MIDNKKGLPQRYYDEFTQINKRLPELAIIAANYITEKGYRTWPKTQTTIVQDEDFRTVLPHKTAATLAGMGWIGKCALLVTNEAGSALRLTVVLTDAPFEYDSPVIKSQCSPDCMACVKACPVNAPSGKIWEAGTDRDDFFDAHACYKAARAYAKDKLDVELTLRGLCISNCPVTMRVYGYG